MATRAKIRITTENSDLCSTYFNMDGHVENWAPTLITALNQTSPENIMKNRQLLKFMFYEEPINDKYLDFLCEVNISGGDYKVTLYNYGKLIFSGTLDEFSAKYDELP